MTWRSVLFSAVGAVLACDPGPSHSGGLDAPAPTIRVAQSDDPAASVSVSSGAVPVEISLVAVRSRDDVVEIEIGLPRALPAMSGARPSLQVGEETTVRSRPGPHGRLDRLVFLVPSEQFSRMRKDAELIVRAGLFTNEAAPSKPRLREAE